LKQFTSNKLYWQDEDDIVRESRCTPLEVQCNFYLLVAMDINDH